MKRHTGIADAFPNYKSSWQANILGGTRAIRLRGLSGHQLRTDEGFKIWRGVQNQGRSAQGFSSSGSRDPPRVKPQSTITKRWGGAVTRDSGVRVDQQECQRKLFFLIKIPSHSPNNSNLCVALYTCLSFCSCWFIFLFVSLPFFASSWSVLAAALPKHPITLGQPIFVAFRREGGCGCCCCGGGDDGGAEASTRLRLV